MQVGRQQILIICPVHNEESNIDYFFNRLLATVQQLDNTKYTIRLLFTNNRSTDGTLRRLIELREQYPWVGYLTLSRNHGYQLSLLSGLSAIEADLYMICDVDCEDPPEMLHPLLAEIEQGHDFVYGIRNNRPDTWLMAKMRKMFYFTLRSLGDYRIIPYMSEFAVFRSKIRDSLISSSNSFPFLRAEVGYAGFEIKGIPYRREARRNGVSHYNYWRAFRFAVSGILSSTTFPLRALLYCLPAVVLTYAGLAISFLAGWCSFQLAIFGTLCVASMYLSCGLAFAAIYLARIYHNGLGRPRFLVDPANTDLPDTGFAMVHARRVA